MTYQSERNLQTVVDNHIFDPNFVEETNRIAAMVYSCGLDFILRTMKARPEFATAIVFEAYRIAPYCGLEWVNDHFAPYVRKEKITFLDPHIFSSCDYGFQGPWTYEVVAQFAEAEASFDQFMEDNETVDEPEVVVMDGEEYVV